MPNKSINTDALERAGYFKRWAFKRTQSGVISRPVSGLFHKQKGVAMKRVILIITSMVLAACAHSGVVSMGPDTYMIANSEWGFTSGSVQKAKVMQEASEYCRSIGKQMLPISTSQNDVSFGKTPAAEVQFRCLSQCDSELQRPSLQPPTTVIENRSK
jgi:hypothetical protein